MIDKKFLGIEITDADNEGTVHVRLVVDLLESVKKKEESRLIYEKARHIIGLRCEPMFDELISFYEWESDEILYAETIFADCMTDAANQLVRLAKRRVHYNRKHARNTGLRVEDLRPAMMLAFIMGLPDQIADDIEDVFRADYGDMYFSRW